MYDVFFICFDETERDKNWQRVLEFHPNATRITIKGISEAHLECNARSTTEKFWTVDGDNWLLQQLKSPKLPIDLDLVFFNAIDAIDETHSTIGAVKLWKKNSIINTGMSKGDFSKFATKTSDAYMEVLSIHKYNSTPYEAWRHAFRHCVKAFSGILPEKALQINIDRMERHKGLNTYSYRGYLDAKEYVKECNNAFEKINLINDFDWLKSKCPKEMQSPLG